MRRQTLGFCLLALMIAPARGQIPGMPHKVIQFATGNVGTLALRAVIDRAKKDQVPAHVIDKAIHMGHLKGCITQFLKAFFERDDVVLRGIRLWGDYSAGFVKDSNWLQRKRWVRSACR